MLLLKKYFYPLLLTFFVLVIVAANYTPGTILSGWDTLHPEFNFGLYTKRVLNGVWQEHQGVGATAAQAHASEITRLPFLFLLDLLLPLNLVRYSFFAVMLAIGPLGLYFASREFLEGKKHASTTSFLGAAFYLLNLVTVQQFYVPLEMFAVHYASLPWLFLFLLSYLKYSRRKDLLVFSVLSLISSSMAHTATLFYIYAATVAMFLATWIVTSTERRKAYLRRATVLLLAIFLTNAYWILPNLYFILTLSDDVRNSTIHSIFSDEAFLQSRSFGNIADLALLRNFLFNWREYDFQQAQFVDLLDEWKAHLTRPLVEVIGILFFVFSFFGMLLAIFRKNKAVASTIPFFLLGVFFWINANEPFTEVFLFLRGFSPTFREGFRFPFTKFSIIMVFALGLYVSLFFSELLKRAKSRLLEGLISFVAVAGLVYFMLPAFTGNLISPSMKVKIPNEYFEMFEWFDSQPAQIRVAKFPVHTFWGWGYHDWGYQGAGFTWFGIKQPTLDREFDRWSRHNESFYKEISSAVYGDDLESLENVLAKYQVGYLFLDESVINAGGSADILYTDELKKMFADSVSIKKEKDFGKVSIYRFAPAGSDSFVFAPTQFISDDSSLTYAEEDVVFQKDGNYIDSGKAFRPFVNFDPRAGVKVEVGENELILTRVLNEPLQTGQINIPDFASKNNNLFVDAHASLTAETVELRLTPAFPQVTVNGSRFPLQPVRSELLRLRREDLSLPSFLVLNNEVFEWTSRSGGERLLGSLVVEGSESFFARVFGDQILNLSSAHTFVEELLGADPRSCSNPDRLFAKELLGQDAFGLRGVEEFVCVGTDFTAVSAGLLQVDIKHSELEGDVSLCVTRRDESECLANLRSDGGSHFVELPEGRYFVNLVVPPQQESRETIVSNIEVGFFESVASGTYPELGFGGSRPQISHPVKESVKEVSAQLPIADRVSRNLPQDTGRKEPFNCDIQSLGTVGREVSGSSVIYEAAGGAASCDFVNFAGIDPTQAYLLRIRGENKEGRSLKIYLQDSGSAFTNLEELLPSDAFDSVYFVTPGDLEGDIATVNLETRSFGGLRSENRIDAIELIPVPIDWLNGITLGRIKGSQNNLNILNSTKTGTAIYKAKVEGSGVLALSQGYDSGWIAVSVNNFQFSIFKHLRLNSWANAWEIPEGTNSIVIFYWPQLLQWIGFIILPVTFVILLRRSRF